MADEEQSERMREEEEASEVSVLIDPLMYVL
jgi:hypothetical protein